MPRATICLTLIVKNETRVLARCLDSIVRFVDCWCIADTGSTDGTQEFICEYFANRNLPGELIERPWRDFATNRNEVLVHAASMADYWWMIDADEEVLCTPSFKLPSLETDAYELLHRGRNSTTTFYRTQLVRSNVPFHYRGVLHEVMMCDKPHDKSRIAGLVVAGHFDGARNLDPVAKYRSDIEVLSGALVNEPNNARYVFYLAQSYRDAKDLERALETYERRVHMGGWSEEQWYAAFQVGLLYERQGYQPDAVDSYLRAYDMRPSRAESLCEVARLYREKRRYQLGFLFAQIALAIPKPDDILFLDEAVYAWRILDEYSICAYFTGNHAKGIHAIERLLTEGHLPEKQRPRVEQNCEFFRKRFATIEPSRL
jgi:hypothetical protein